jgi:hypothetical protein
MLDIPSLRLQYGLLNQEGSLIRPVHSNSIAPSLVVKNMRLEELAFGIFLLFIVKLALRRLRGPAITLTNAWIRTRRKC